MPAPLPLQDAISQETFSFDIEYRVLKAQYGNGYSQRARDGINGSVATGSLSWENISEADFETLTAAFDAAYGVDYFTYKVKGDSATKKWTITKWSRKALSGQYYSVSASLEQVFDL